MLFNSINFAFFLPVVFILYWFGCRGNRKAQNFLLLIASYTFYGWWDYRFLFLLAFSTFLDFFTGLRIADARTDAWRKAWLFISISINLGFLFFFKYYNFFVDSMVTTLRGVGYEGDVWTLSILLPVGISFYTFHGISYVVDIYYKKVTPTRDFIDYSVFVSFFPLLVAGPIERATHLLPQIQAPRAFSGQTATDGLRQMLWGFFKKIVIADNCAILVNDIFNHHETARGSTLVLGAVLFAFQIYGDFSGYSDIAIGVSRLFGFDLIRNFAYPYFSRDIAEFWRRWHISLSSWFRDYLYIPLGGSRSSTLLKVRNTFIIFIVSGFWHGANWTFLVWGALNAVYFLPLLLLQRNRSNLDVVAQGKILPSFRDIIAMGTTFTLTTFAWIFFRADSLGQAFSYIGGIFSRSLFSMPRIDNRPLLVLIALFLAIEWMGREQKYALEKIKVSWPIAVRWSFYLLLIWVIGTYGGTEQDFIYFQF
jgi:D-alanyl-lipoteichoic acid acyltransferase DltB (MBOAT superfamily)